MLKSLRARNVALMIVIVLIAQLLTTMLVMLLVIRPQTGRLATILAHNVAAISATLSHVPPDRGAALIARINRGGGIRLLPANAEPPEDRGIPTLLEAEFMRAFAREMREDSVVIWHGGRTGQLWAKVTLAGKPYWVSYERPPGWSPSGALIAAIVLAVILALVAGLIVRRWLDAPLRTLVEAADTMRGEGVMPRLTEDGPHEIAAVASAFNRMATRLAAQDADRTFMLAGISHDLRTPLAKIRLALAIEQGIAPEMHALLLRQLDHMERMLGQFLDFARGRDAEQPAPCGVRAAVGEALDQLGIDPVAADGIAPAITVDVRRLGFQRSIVNILRNALIHGAPPITIACTAAQGWLHLTIADHGPGAASELLAHLHEPFVRGHSERPSDGGAGLGLAIARQFADQHCGSLSFANQPGGGLAVTLTLPMPKMWSG